MDLDNDSLQDPNNDSDGCKSNNIRSISEEELKQVRDKLVSFKVPPSLAEEGYEIFTWRENSISAASKCGVKVVVFEEDSSEINEKRTPLWFCLLCSPPQQFRLSHSSTSTATKHLKRAHQIVSQKTSSNLRKTMALKQKQNLDSKFRLKDPERFYGLSTSKMIVNRCLPFRLVSGEDLSRIVMRTGFPKLNEKKVKNYILEFSNVIREKIKIELSEARKLLRVPFVHLMADLYTSKVQNLKYFGLRISFTDARTCFQTDNDVGLKSYCLAVRLYEPPSKMVDEAQYSSDLLKRWCQDIFRSFGLAEEDLLTATTDGGSDIKRLASILGTGVSREWCIAHLLNLCLIDGFDANENHGPRADTARSTTNTIRRTFEFFNRSSKYTGVLKEIQRKILGKCIKLVNFAPQRWSSAARFYRTALTNYEVFQAVENKYHVGLEITKVPKKRLHELASLLETIYTVTEESQGNEIVAMNSICGLLSLMKDINPDEPLMLYDDPDNNTAAPEGGKRAFVHLDIVTQTTITRLAGSLETRYFDRFNPYRSLKSRFRKQFYRDADLKVTQEMCMFDYAFELVLFLVPGIPHQKILKGAVEPVVNRMDDSDIPAGLTRGDLVTMQCDRIKSLAFEILLNRVDEDAKLKRVLQRCLVETEGSSSRYDQREKVEKKQFGKGRVNFVAQLSFDTPKKNRRVSRLSSSGAHRATASNPVDVRGILKEEIGRYLDTYVKTDKARGRRAKKNDDDTIDGKNAIDFWRSLARTPQNNAKFKLLPFFALSFLSCRQSAAALERDFSPASDIVTRKRSSMHPWVVEMMMLVKTNIELLPNDFSDIPPMKERERLLEKCHFGSNAVAGPDQDSSVESESEGNDSGNEQEGDGFSLGNPGAQVQEEANSIFSDDFSLPDVPGLNFRRVNTFADDVVGEHERGNLDNTFTTNIIEENVSAGAGPAVASPEESSESYEATNKRNLRRSKRKVVTTGKRSNKKTATTGGGVGTPKAKKNKANVS